MCLKALCGEVPPYLSVYLAIFIVGFYNKESLVLWTTNTVSLRTTTPKTEMHSYWCLPAHTTFVYIDGEVSWKTNAITVINTK